jgi:hypothetical protein
MTYFHAITPSIPFTSFVDKVCLWRRSTDLMPRRNEDDDDAYDGKSKQKTGRNSQARTASR